jgi:hypothetical protein
MVIRSGALIATALFFSHGALADCSVSASRNAEMDAADVRNVVIHARAGDLAVRGAASTTQVRAKGQACADSQKGLDAIRIDIRRDGDTIHLEAVMPEHGSFINIAKLDLAVELPGAVDVRIEDSSGDISVAGVASAKVDDSSGDQAIHDIAGNVTVRDSSGEIDIKNIRGSVEVSDSSGDVLIADVTGSVTIPVDSSGGLTFRRVHGGVHIKNDSSGDISITDVNQDVTIDNDSAGDIRVVDIGGQFTVAHDSTGDIDHRNVLGNVNIPRSKRD